MQSVHNITNMTLTRRREKAQGARFVFVMRLGRLPRIRCDGCKCDFEKDPGPVLYDRFWKRIARDHELLCHQCVVKRLGTPLMWWHILDCPWNTTFFQDDVFSRMFGKPRNWWRGPSAFRVRNYGRYVYDEATMVRAAYGDAVSMVEGNGLFEEPSEPGAPSGGYATGGTYRG